MTGTVEGGGLRLRRATRDDLDFLLALEAHDDVAPFLEGGSARSRDDVVAEIEEQHERPRDVGRFVIEVEEGGDWRPAGAMSFHIVNRRSRIAYLGRLAVHPDFRGRRLSDEAARLLCRHLLLDLDYHRLELQIYGFNERAQRHAERAGFVREGVKRRAYWYDGEWVDGLLYGLIREDLGSPP